MADSPENENGGDFEPVPPPVPTSDFTVRAEQLLAIVDEYEPDLIHSLAFQQAGGLTDVARGLRGGLPCPWLASSWGSCITMSPRVPGYLERTVSILRGADYFAAECHREVAIARSLGMTARPVGVWPNVVGIDAALARSLAAPGPTSERRGIMVKGALSGIQTGRVMVEALDLAGEALAGYEVCSYQTDPRIEDDFRAVAERHGATYEPLSSFRANERTHEDILAAHGRSRVSVALNRSDGMSISFVEALAAGSYPVHSATGCAHELVPEGRGASYVDPEDPADVAAAIRRALTDDELVDAAAASNFRTAAEFLDTGRNRDRVLGAYERIADETVTEMLASPEIAAEVSAGTGEDRAGDRARRRELLARRYLLLERDGPAPRLADLFAGKLTGPSGAGAVVDDLEWLVELQSEALELERLRWAHGEWRPEDAPPVTYVEEIAEARAAVRELDRGARVLETAILRLEAEVYRRDAIIANLADLPLAEARAVLVREATDPVVRTPPVPASATAAERPEARIPDDRFTGSALPAETGELLSLREALRAAETDLRSDRGVIAQHEMRIAVLEDTLRQREARIAVLEDPARPAASTAPAADDTAAAPGLLARLRGKS